MKKKALKFLGVLVVLIALLFAGIIFRLFGVVGTADEFLDAAKQGDVDRAHALLAKEFKIYTSKDDLLTYFDNLELREIEDVEWGERGVSGELGSLAATVTLENGDIKPLFFGMRKEDDEWRIFRIDDVHPGDEVKDDGPVIPDEQLLRLVNKSTLAFAEAVHEQSMEPFWNHISVLWREQIDVVSLDGTFWSFYAHGADLRELGEATPVFSGPPALDDRGVLKVAGYYPLEEETFNFEHSYIKEGLGWKLVGFSANIEQ